MAHVPQRKLQPNLLEGPLFKKILVFILPLMLTNLLQRLYNAADMIIVGMSGVEGALGAIGTTGAMVNLILNIFMGLSVGTNVVVARWIGSGDRTETERAVHTSLVVSLIFGTACGILGQIVCRPILILLGDEGHILDMAVLYCRVYFAGAPFISLMNFSICIFRAKGNTKTPLYILSGSGLINVLLNLFFVLACDMHVDGVALATIISNTVAAGILVWKLSREDDWCRVVPKKLKLHKKSFGEILRIGIPSSLQAMMFSFSNMFVQSSIISVNNTLCPGGSAVIDGNAAASNLETFVYTATNSVYQGSVTFVSQHYGAGKMQRLKKVIKSFYLTSFLVAIIAAGIIFLFQEPLTLLYVTDPLAVEAANLRDYVLLSVYFTLGFVEVGSGILRGMGRSTSSAVITLLGVCAFRVLWNVVVVPIYPTLFCIYLSFPISWVITTTVNFIYMLGVLKKETRKAEARMTAQ